MSKQNLFHKQNQLSIQDFLKDDPELTDEERFELYYDERERL